MSPEQLLREMVLSLEASMAAASSIPSLHEAKKSASFPSADFSSSNEPRWGGLLAADPK